MADRRLCTFRLAGLRIGIDIDRIREVLADPEVTPVPLAPPSVTGLLNLRGQILTVVDARTRLSLPSVETDRAAHVIVEHGDEVVSLVVDDEDEVIDVDEDDLEPVPTTVSEAIRRCASGSYQLSPGLLVVLDVDILLAQR